MAKGDNTSKRTVVQDDDFLSLRNIRANFSRRLQAISIAFVVVLGLGMVAYFSAVPTGGPEEGGYGKNIALVNGEPISREQFEFLVEERMRERALLSGDALGAIGVRAQVFQEQVEQALIAQAAHKERISISDRDLNREIEKLVDEQIKQERQRAAQGKELTDEQFERIIRNSVGKSVAEWRKELIQSWEPRKPMLRQELLRQRLIEKVAKVPNPSDEELKRSYDLLSVRHILVSTGNRTEEQARKRAEEILQKVRSGSDFAKLAREFSDDPGSKENGGSLPPVSRSQLSSTFVPEFAKAVEALQPGQVSDLVKTQYGFHIIRLDSVKPNVPADFEKKKAEYAKQYVETQRNAKWQQYLQQLRQGAKIEVLDPELKAFQALEELQKLAGKPEYTAGLTRVIEAFEKATQEMPSADAMVVLGLLYQQQSQQPGLAEPARKQAREKAIAAWQNALQRIESVQLRFMLADLYRQEKQDDLAIQQYQEIGKVAWDNPAVHAQLKSIYQQMGRKDLVQKEIEWEKRYQERMRAERAPAQTAPAQKP
ncbi:MAG: peptidylprolyl isomerase [bacterium]|nr:peptidylprolyl isomerase [bacterium]MCS7310009.1 peptidylprolyl isomerase [Armatimonadota bacterium]